MKILVVSWHHLDANSVGSLRSRALAKYLPRFGFEVSVLAQPHKASTSGSDGNVITLPKGPWLSQALLHSKKIFAATRPDLILASYPPVEALEVGILLSRLYRVPLISDFRDGLLFEALEEKTSVDRAHYAKIESGAVNQASMVLTVSPALTDYFRQRYSHPRVVTLYSGYDPDDILPLENARLPGGVLNIVHAGRLDHSRPGTSQNGNGLHALRHGLLRLVEARPEFINKVLFHFVGDLSPREKEILAPAVEQGLVKIWGSVGRRVSLGFQRQADMLLLITVPNLRSLVTGKIFEYLNSGKPILALTKGTEAEKIIRRTRSGILVPPNDAQMIFDALVNILERAQRGESLSGQMPNQHKIEKYARDKQIKRLASQLAELNRSRRLWRYLRLPKRLLRRWLSPTTTTLASS